MRHHTQSQGPSRIAIEDGAQGCAELGGVLDVRRHAWADASHGGCSLGSHETRLNRLLSHNMCSRCSWRATPLAAVEATALIVCGCRNVAVAIDSLSPFAASTSPSPLGFYVASAVEVVVPSHPRPSYRHIAAGRWRRPRCRHRSPKPPSSVAFLSSVVFVVLIVVPLCSRLSIATMVAAFAAVRRRRPPPQLSASWPRSSS